MLWLASSGPIAAYPGVGTTHLPSSPILGATQNTGGLAATAVGHQFILPTHPPPTWPLEGDSKMRWRTSKRNQTTKSASWPVQCERLVKGPLDKSASLLLTPTLTFHNLHTLTRRKIYTRMFATGATTTTATRPVIVTGLLAALDHAQIPRLGFMIAAIDGDLCPGHGVEPIRVNGGSKEVLEPMFRARANKGTSGFSSRDVTQNDGLGAQMVTFMCAMLREPPQNMRDMSAQLVTGREVLEEGEQGGGGLGPKNLCTRNGPIRFSLL